MKYLSPEIEAWSKDSNTKSLVRPGVSCGIFQEYNVKTSSPTHNQPPKTKQKK
ncbi:hypothetical protein ACJOV8_005725 [Formosa sp. 3Alg 14/1]|uniref:hypothetical protein n=1 Tax=unclassified Formosa TaxID=2644710 RepID=UPI0039BDE521